MQEAPGWTASHRARRYTVGEPVVNRPWEGLNQYQTPYASSPAVTPQGVTAASESGGVDYSQRLARRHQHHSFAGSSKTGVGEPYFGAVDTQDVESVFSFTAQNKVDAVSAIIDRGVPINVRDAFGNTLLMIACKYGHKRTVKMALRRGADIDARNFRGETALQFCYAFGHGDTLGAYLLSKGATGHLPNGAGLRPSQGWPQSLQHQS